MVTSEVVVGLCSVSLWCCNEAKTLVVDFHNCKKLPHRGGVIAFSHEDSGGSFWLTHIFMEIHFVGCTSLPSQHVHAVGKTELLTRSMFVPPATRLALLHHAVHYCIYHLPSEKVGTVRNEKDTRPLRNVNEIVSF